MRCAKQNYNPVQTMVEVASCFKIVKAKGLYFFSKEKMVSFLTNAVGRMLIQDRGHGGVRGHYGVTFWYVAELKGSENAL